MLVPTLLSEEHDALSESVRGLLARRCTRENRRRTFEEGEGHDQSLWAELIRQFELPGLAVSEEDGGSGFGPLETFVVAAELGRVLAPTPYLSVTGLAANLLVEAGTAETRRAYLPGLIDGTILATAAIAEEGGWSARPHVVRAASAGEGAVLSGSKHFVTDGARADLLLVTADLDGRTAVFAVDAHDLDPGRIEPLTTLDLTRPQAHVHFDHTRARLVSGPSEDCTTAVQRALDRASLILVGEACGAAEHLMNSAVEYARSRVQFARPIGSFQAIKHKLVDMAFDLERMWTAGLNAARCAALDEAFPLEISLARSFCAEAYFRIAAEHIQVLGGIGFTWEHDAHLYFRHAKSLEFLLGSPQEARERLVSLLEIARS